MLHLNPPPLRLPSPHPTPTPPRVSSFGYIAVANLDSDGGGDIGRLKALRVLRALRLIKLVRLLRASRIIQRWETR